MFYLYPRNRFSFGRLGEKENFIEMFLPLPVPCAYYVLLEKGTL